MSLETVCWGSRLLIKEAMASTVILKKYSDGIYVGTFWSKSRHGKGRLIGFTIGFVMFRLNMFELA